MQFTVRTPGIIFALLELSLAAPQGNHQGSLSVSIDLSHHEHKTTQGENRPSSTDGSNGGVNIGCTGLTFDPNDVAQAVQDMFNWCDGSSLPSYSGRWWAYQTAVVYLCNYEGYDMKCDPANNGWQTVINDYVTPLCGSGKGGWYLQENPEMAWGVDGNGKHEC